MLATRIIPTLLTRRGELVKGRAFGPARVVGHALQAIRIYQQREVDELIVLDIGATPDGRGPDIDLVRSFAGECFMPVTVGGGITSCDDIRALLANGADKVAICTAALERPAFIAEASQRFGAQAVVAAVDVRGGVVCSRRGSAAHACGAVEWACDLERLGAGEILLTSVDRDGTLRGYDLDLIRAVSSAVNIPVIAAGGAGNYEHLAEGLRAGAHAVAAGALWSFTDSTPKGAARYLAKQGFAMRCAA